MYKSKPSGLVKKNYSFWEKSSSFHRINADRGLAPLTKCLWFMANLLVNILGYVVTDKTSKVPYRTSISDLNTMSTSLPSPSRLVSDIFWKNLNWKLVERELGTVNILDIGCGNGNYYQKFWQYSGGIIDSYRGVDVKEHPDWSKLETDGECVTFEKISAGFDPTENIPRGTNLIVSQSALEHIEDDLMLFRNIRRYVDRFTDSLIQIHLIPSEACLYLYWFHGIRQYSRWSLLRTANLFVIDSYWKIVGLGGPNSNRVHWQYITPLPFRLRTDSRKMRRESYKRALVKAVMNDEANNISRCPSFYALIIHTNYTSRIFDSVG